MPTNGVIKSLRDGIKVDNSGGGLIKSLREILRTSYQRPNLENFETSRFWIILGSIRAPNVPFGGAPLGGSLWVNLAILG
jgi:hypothetical protein